MSLHPIEARMEGHLREARREAAESTLDAISVIESQLGQLAVALNLLRQVAAAHLELT